MLRFALFDLDNTLYPASSGVWEAIGSRINLYMIEKLGMHPDEVSERRDHYLRSFGTTLRGLGHDYDLDPAEFLRYVHDVPLERYLRSDPELDGMLERMTLEKAIFTNADEPHARRVLSCLGIARHFPIIIDIRALDFVNKPDLPAYRRAMEILHARAEECVFVDDSPENLRPARELGMLTVLVQEPGAAVDGADHHIPSVIHLERVLKAVR